MVSRETPDARMNRLLAEARALPASPGVYVFHNADGEEIYVGKAVNLSARVRTYFEDVSRHDPKTAALVEVVEAIEVFPTESEVEALLLENRMIKEMQPRFNISLRDSKSFPYLVITWSDDFPRVYVSREKPRSADRFYGPFVSASELRSALRHLQRVFRFRSCKLVIVEGAKENRHRRPCLNYHIGRCTAPCSGMVSRADYRENIRRLSMFISGTRAAVLDELRKQMRSLSTQRLFEQAAVVRDQIRALESLGERGSLDDASHPVIAPIDLSDGLDQLQSALGLRSRPRMIDGMDISNLGPGEMVGAVVTFVDGMPQRGGYRRFRIKTVQGQDDFAAIAEVARRRYSRLIAERTALPDIVLVDGGVGHFNAAAGALKEVNMPAQTVLLALAKEEETVYAAQGPLDLPPHGAAKRLLMYVRDEAHRFAQHYHHILRRKFLLEK